MSDPLTTLTPSEFEHLVADYLRQLGYHQVEVIGGPGDMGIDISCLNQYEQRIGIQCKRYQQEKKVSAIEVRHLFTSLHGHTPPFQRGLFATSSSFTWGAVKNAAHFDIGLVDGKELGEFYEGLLAARREALLVECVLPVMLQEENAALEPRDRNRLGQPLDPTMKLWIWQRRRREAILAPANRSDPERLNGLDLLNQQNGHPTPLTQIRRPIVRSTNNGHNSRKPRCRS